MPHSGYSHVQTPTHFKFVIHQKLELKASIYVRGLLTFFDYLKLSISHNTFTYLDFGLGYLEVINVEFAD